MGGPPLTEYLLDTHIWLWHLGRSDRLPAGLRHVINERGSACWLSPVSIWEAGLMLDGGRFGIDRPFDAWVRDALAALPLRDAPMTREVALAGRDVHLPHRDPADRFLAATAIVYGITLLTVDKRLTRTKGVPTRST